MCYLDYGGILSRLESESTNGRLVFGLPPIGCCSPCLLSSHNGVPLCLLFYSLSILVLLPFPRFRGWGTIWAFISISTLPLPHWISFVSECHQLFTTSGSNWLIRVLYSMWHMPFGQQIQWFSRISFQKSWTNVNFTKKLITSPESAVEKIFQS